MTLCISDSFATLKETFIMSCKCYDLKPRVWVQYSHWFRMQGEECFDCSESRRSIDVAMCIDNDSI